MQQILLIVQIFVALGLIALVLMQQGRGADAGAAFGGGGGGGGGGAGSLFGARGPATMLTRATAILATVFFLNSIGLAYLSKQESVQNRSVMERVETGAGGDATVPVVPSGGAGGAQSEIPSVPSSEGGRESDGATN